MIPLRIQVLFHWESQEARRLAKQLYQTFSARPAGSGPRIPIRYGPRRGDGGPAEAFPTAEHEIFVVLVDECMAWRARAPDRSVADATASFVTRLVKAHGPEAQALTATAFN